MWKPFSFHTVSLESQDLLIKKGDRMIFHINENRHVTASQMAQLFHLDPGYIIRLVRGFYDSGIVIK